MAEKNDVRTLGIGDGLTLTSPDPKLGVLRFTLTEEVLAYLGTTTDAVREGKHKLILKFDFSDGHKKPFIGIGKKFEK